MGKICPTTCHFVRTRPFRRCRRVPVPARRTSREATAGAHPLRHGEERSHTVLTASPMRTGAVKRTVASSPDHARAEQSRLCGCEEPERQRAVRDPAAKASTTTGVLVEMDRVVVSGHAGKIGHVLGGDGAHVVGLLPHTVALERPERRVHAASILGAEAPTACTGSSTATT